MPVVEPSASLEQLLF